MSKQTINIGASPNDGTGTPLRTSFDYTNQNFTELYTALGGGVGLPGATTQVIFNDGGTNLAGDAGLVYNKTTDALTVAGLVTAGSATITGDLTVDTSTLKVDSTNNRVGIGTASPIVPLDIRSNGDNAALFLRTTDPAAAVASAYIKAPVSTGFSSTVPVYGFWYRNSGMGNPAADTLNWIIASGETMRLNSTGLGIGRSPSYRLQASSGTKATTASIATVGAITTTDTDDFGIYFRLKTDATGANRYAAITAFDNGSGNGPRDLVLQDLGGNVGIGVTPSAWGASLKAFELGAKGNALFTTTSVLDGLFMVNNAYYDTSYKYASTGYASRYTHYQGAHQWFTAASGTAGNAITFTQAMTLDASGNLLVGLTVDSYTPAKGVSMFSGNSSRVAVGHANGTSSGDYYHSFAYDSTLIGSISQNGTTGVLYNTSSDYRLKESVKPISSGLARVNALKPSIYNWKSDGSTGEGFLAHELAEVVPFAVSGEKDAVNADGTIKSQGIDMSRIVPILVAAIQELTAEVNALKNA